MNDTSQEVQLDSCEWTALTMVISFHSLHREYPIIAEQLDSTIVFPKIDTLDLPTSELEEFNLQMSNSRSFMSSWERCKATFDSIYFKTNRIDSSDIFWIRQSNSIEGHKKWVKEHWRLKPSTSDSIDLQFIGLEMKVDSLDRNGNIRTYKSNMGE